MPPEDGMAGELLLLPPQVPCKLTGRLSGSLQRFPVPRLHVQKDVEHLQSVRSAVSASTEFTPLFDTVLSGQVSPRITLLCAAKELL